MRVRAGMNQPKPMMGRAVRIPAAMKESGARPIRWAMRVPPQIAIPLITAPAMR